MDIIQSKWVNTLMESVNPKRVDESLWQDFKELFTSKETKDLQDRNAVKDFFGDNFIFRYVRPTYVETRGKVTDKQFGVYVEGGTDWNDKYKKTPIAYTNWAEIMYDTESKKFSVIVSLDKKIKQFAKYNYKVEQTNVSASTVNNTLKTFLSPEPAWDVEKILDKEAEDSINFRI